MREPALLCLLLILAVAVHCQCQFEPAQFEPPLQSVTHSVSYQRHVSALSSCLPDTTHSLLPCSLSLAITITITATAIIINIKENRTHRKLVNAEAFVAKTAGEITENEKEANIVGVCLVCRAN